MLGGTLDESGGPTEPTPASVFDGVNGAFCEALGIRDLRHKSALIAIAADVPGGAVRAGYHLLANNWRRCLLATGGGGSTQNWRWRLPQLVIADHNRSPEVMLERALIRSCERQGRQDWANQIPVASGLAGPAKERRRAIDLVHQVAPGHFELIELKIASDNPLYAALEIIGYTGLWLLSRRAGHDNALLAAQRIDAVVWAPDSFYAPYDVQMLGTVLGKELAELGAKHGLTLSFRFESFPDPLGRPPFTDDSMTALLGARHPV